MSIKRTVSEIKSLLREVEAIKANLSEELRRIDADDTRSGSYKEVQRGKARSEATARLKALSERVEDCVTALKENSRNVVSFDYSNPKLAAAISFIVSAGKDLPEAAAEQIIRDFKGHPAEMKYISGLFAQNGLIAFASDAAEAADGEMKIASLPERLGDKLYYSTLNPTTNDDFSGLENELDSFAAFVGEQE